jgi:hypothetical protein
MIARPKLSARQHKAMLEILAGLTPVYLTLVRMGGQSRLWSALAPGVEPDAADDPVPRRLSWF